MKVDLSMPFAPTATADGRRAIGEVLRADSFPAELCADLELLVHELLANALRHGRALPDGSVRLSFRSAHRRLRVVVIDGGTGPAFAAAVPQVPAGPTVEARESGYGLVIAAALGRLVIHRDGDGTRVSVSVESAGRAGPAT